MKNKLKLSFKGKIFASFVLCCFCVVVLRQNIEAILWFVVSPGSMDEAPGSLQEWVLYAAGLMVFVLGAFAFYGLTTRIIKRESERRVREQNLVYAAIAHDLKTPMTSVQGFARALADGKVRPEEQREVFGIICRKSNAMNDMVNALFDYARLGTEGYRPERVEIDLCALVRDVLAEHYADLEAHGIEPEIIIPDDPITIRGDKGELRRALTNLVVNVYKHNPEGTRAKVSVGRQDKRAVVTVADSGPAIPGGLDIFEPFVTENAARTAGQGTGLGLAITKRILLRHSGDVTLREGDDGYTKAFVIEL